MKKKVILIVSSLFTGIGFSSAQATPVFVVYSNGEPVAGVPVEAESMQITSGVDGEGCFWAYGVRMHQENSRLRFQSDMVDFCGRSQDFCCACQGFSSIDGDILNFERIDYRR